MPSKALHSDKFFAALQMLAFPMATREEIDAQHARGQELDATNESAPGERMPTFYGGYIRDPDGNMAVFYKMD